MPTGTTSESSEQRFKDLLKELFQFARADLNFGIYRVMRQKHDALDAFINNDIVAAVDAALEGEAGDMIRGDKEKLLDILKPILEVMGGANAEGNVKEAWELLHDKQPRQSPTNTGSVRDDVFNHLYTFFSYYYDEGDFMCKQRYSADGRYAVPYNGEEVVLHWANKDQYYIKTTEHFPLYEYNTGGKVVRFEMRDADLERDNNKSKGDKLFIPLSKKFAALQKPKGVYVLPFEYRALTGEESVRYNKTQKDENGNTLSTQEKVIKAAVAALPDIDKLEAHITRYIKRNTADYFIHKNLRKFFQDELDYYINKHLLNTEDLVRNNANTRASFKVAKAVRAAGLEIIDFLAQLEDFQKAVWEKKKFITQTNYIITLQNIHNKALLQAVAGNDAQWQEWRDFNFIPDSDKKKLAGKATAKARLEFMQAHPTLTVDTKHFPPDFKADFLATLADIDGSISGVLFHGENWQALNIMQQKYRGKIKCVYIDPPYNAPKSEILYKNDFKHSAWLSLMNERVLLSNSLQPENGVLIIAIDENEHIELSMSLKGIFSDSAYSIHDIAVVHNPQGVQGKHFSYTNEYAIFIAPDDKDAISKVDIDPRPEILRDDTGNTYLRTDAKNCFYPIFVKDDAIIGFGDVPADDFHPADRIVEKDGYVEIYPIKDGVERKWRFARQSVESIKDDLFVKTTKQRGKDIFQTKKAGTAKTVWDNSEYQAGNKYGTNLLAHVLGGVFFDYPKSVRLVEDCIKISSDDNDYVLDYFSGSGTTAHAVINLNRDDNGSRKFILVEMGEYFNTVLVPRIKKVVFSPEWKGGKPQRAATEEEAVASPRIIKYHHIESYDDALDNIEFKEKFGSAGTGQLVSAASLYDDYTPRYMLAAESRACPTFASGSDEFKSPFAYTLVRANNKPLVTADMPETFAYLIGLQEQTRKVVMNGKCRYVIQTGIAENQQTAIIWRDTVGWEQTDYKKEQAFFDGHELLKGATRIYVNDTSLIKGAKSLTPLFAKCMFGEGNQ